MGFIPWAIDDVPFTDSPTMVIGIDSFGKIGSGTGLVMAMVATTEVNLAKYWSNAEFGSKDYTFAQFIEKNVDKAIKFFVEENECLPFRIIVFREGVSRG